MKQCDLKEKQDVSTAEAKILDEMVERLVKSLLDIFVLAKLQAKSELLGGYDVMELLYQDFGVLISSGTVYAVLYSMEREGLIKGEDTRSKRGYLLTEKGEKRFNDISEVKTGIVESLTKIFTQQ